MKEDRVEKLVTKFGDKMLNWAESAEGFAETQAPKLINEILTFHMIEAWFYIGIFLIPLLFAIWYWRKVYRGDYKDIDEKPDGEQVLFGVQTGGAVAATIGSTIAILVNAHTLLMIHFAPRLYLVDYLKDFV